MSLSSHKKQYVKDLLFKHILRFEISAREICEKFVYKYLEIIE